MNLTTRSIILALLLLLLFLGTTLTLQWWLAHETRKLQTMAIEEQRVRLTEVLTLSGRRPEQWDEAFQRELSTLVGGTVRLLKPGTPLVPPAKESLGLAFVQELPGTPDWRAQVHFASPALLRMQTLHQLTLVVTVVLSLLVATVPLLLVLVSSRRSAGTDGATNLPWASVRAEKSGLEHFAKISNERTVDLAREHGARVRAEENLEVNRTLLDHSVAERVRLGRELHDDICQTLYAVGLTVESARSVLSGNPAEADRRLAQCVGNLNRIIRDVRNYITGLAPEKLSRLGLTAALEQLLQELRGEREVSLSLTLDEDAAAILSPVQMTELLQISREAISNSLRHGKATRITVRLHRTDREVGLLVQDNGPGFTQAGRGVTGRGLGNMQARAAQLGGGLRIDSRPGDGTRVVLTLPI
jgi:signal transduction histidine kinase